MGAGHLTAGTIVCLRHRLLTPISNSRAGHDIRKRVWRPGAEPHGGAHRGGVSGTFFGCDYSPFLKFM